MGEIIRLQRNKMATFFETLAQDVKAYRKDHRLSQAKFAERVGTERTAIVRLERMETLPRVNALNAIWALLHPQSTEHVAETPPPYITGQPCLSWIQHIIESDAPYEEKIRAIHHATTVEMQVIARKPSA